MQRVEFDPRALDDARFSELYKERIEPILRAREADRQAALAAHRDRTGWVMWGSIAAALAAVLLFQYVLAAAVAGLFAYGLLNNYALAPLAAVARSTKDGTLAAVAEGIGCTHQAEGFDPDPHNRLLALHLLPQSERTHFRDRFTGTINGRNFSFFKARLENKRTEHGWYPVFEGHLIRLATSKQFAGTTILRRDAGVLNNWLEGVSVSGRLERTYLGSPELDKAFEVYSSDQFEARYLADFAFMPRLIELAKRFKGRDLRCAFKDGELLVALEIDSAKSEDAERGINFFERLMVYETYHKVGESVTEEKAAEIEEALDGQTAPKSHTMSAPLDTLDRAKAMTADVVETLRVINGLMDVT